MPNARPCVVLIACLAGCLAAAVRAEEPPSANDVLDKAIAELATLKSYTMHVDSDVEFVEVPAKAKPDAVAKEFHEFDVRVDGVREDLLEYWSNIRRGRTEREPQFKTRSVWDGKRELARQRFQGRGGENAGVDASVQRTHRDFRLAYSIDGLLHGFAWGDPKPMVQLLRESGKAQLRPKTEEVDGHACDVIEARTERGMYTVWLDPEAGYHVRRAVVVREPGDLWYDRKLDAKATDTTQSHSEIRIDRVQIERLGERWLPMRGTMEARSLFASGRELFRVTCKRSNIDPKPNFEGSDAFVMDGIPNGAEVVIMGDDGVQSGTTTWRDGDVEAEAYRAAKH
jgi:hypothetical protein